MDYFARIKNNSPLDTEELRSDVCENIINGITYIALAPRDSATAQPVWAVVKVERDGKGDITRERLFLDAIWDLRKEL
jgi:hypothetical protein